VGKREEKKDLVKRKGEEGERDEMRLALQCSTASHVRRNEFQEKWRALGEVMPSRHIERSHIPENCRSGKREEKEVVDET